MAGYLSIKAYGLQDQTTFQFNELQDLHGGAWLLFCATSRWLAIRLDSIIAIYITIVAGKADFSSEVRLGYFLYPDFVRGGLFGTILNL